MQYSWRIFSKLDLICSLKSQHHTDIICFGFLRDHSWPIVPTVHCGLQWWQLSSQETEWFLRRDTKLPEPSPRAPAQPQTVLHLNTSSTLSDLSVVSGLWTVCDSGWSHRGLLLEEKPELKRVLEQRRLELHREEEMAQRRPSDLETELRKRQQKLKEVRGQQSADIQFTTLSSNLGSECWCFSKGLGIQRL